MAFHTRLRFGPSEIIALMAVGLLVLLVTTGHHHLLIDILYGPYTALIAVIMLVEYILLKGADRSPIYRRELETARQKRRDDVLALRSMEADLALLRSRINAVRQEPQAEPETLQAALGQAHRTIEELLARIRERI